jgi:four helix bundle protein
VVSAEHSPLAQFEKSTDQSVGSHIQPPGSDCILGRCRARSAPIVQSYRDLIVWKKAMPFVLAIDRSTEGVPKTETYGLTSQFRRAAVSVPSNIAEGQGRRSTEEFKQFLGNARGSLMEVETQILIARELGYLKQPDAENLLSVAAKVGRILNGLLASLPNRG